MSVPSSILVECPICGCETLHEILAGRIGGRTRTSLESTVRCRECGHVHKVSLRAEKPIQVPVIISWLERSTRSSISLGADEVLSVGDEVICGEDTVLVTSIESKGARVERARAGDIGTIWGKRFDKVRVPFSISRLGRTFSEFVLAVPDEEFYIGDMLQVGKHEVVIHSIKLKDRSLKKGGARAKDIVRVYANIVRKTSS